MNPFQNKTSDRQAALKHVQRPKYAVGFVVVNLFLSSVQKNGHTIGHGK